jgi:hypothetical protein
MAGSERERLIRSSDGELLAECEIDRYRASGPGGQKRNKTESAVRLRHQSGVSAHADDSRSQHENKARALRRLRAKLAIDIREPAAGADREMLAKLVEVRAGEKIRRSADYLVGVGVLLDILEAAAWAMGDAARSIDVSTSSLSRFVTADERIVRKVNEARSAAGMRPLRS